MASSPRTSNNTTKRSSYAYYNRSITTIAKYPTSAKAAINTATGKKTVATKLNYPKTSNKASF